ncbi:MAG TPA: AraC family transcriptional regulator [Lachnospiraceae bacterium]|nr:AraC family transcriptional regulator [Lachnospiraceae bacterium]
MNPAEFRKAYNDLNISFSLENYSISASNIVFEKFLRSIPMHSHSSNSYEIHYIAYGKGMATIDGRDYEVGQNVLYITGPHIEHAQIPAPEDPMAEYCVYLRLEEKTPCPKKDCNNQLVHTFVNRPFWFGQDSHNIHTIMQALFWELENKYPGYKIEAETLLKQLLVAIVRNYSYTKETSSPLETQVLNDNQYLTIEECFLYEYNTLTLPELSDRLGLSSRQTERLLQKHYGKTFLSKKTEAKMSAAVLLLRNPAKTITEISEELGYSSVEHFSSAFKRYYHINARQYRKTKI